MIFYKYQCAGNDFIMIDNRQEKFPKNDNTLIAQLCHRRFGIGADGLILLENVAGYDFKMIYYNADGREGTMCGNGGRCVVAFAKELGIIADEATFVAVDGSHYATIEDGLVRLQMADVTAIEMYDDYVFLNTGSPHNVEWVDDFERIDVKKIGAKLRYSDRYKAIGGSNINFVGADKDGFTIRTYERGVEDETYACGTGATAAAIALYHTGRTLHRDILLHAVGGDLQVSFECTGKAYTNVFLKGEAKKVFKGETNELVS